MRGEADSPIGRALRASPSEPGDAAEFMASGDIQVVERVRGSSSTDWWGVAHVPSRIEDEVLTEAALERRLDLLQACYDYFNETAGGVSGDLVKARAAAVAIWT